MRTLNEVKSLWLCQGAFKICLKMMGGIQILDTLFVSFSVSLLNLFLCIYTPKVVLQSCPENTNLFIEFPPKWWIWVKLHHFDRSRADSKSAWCPDVGNPLFFDFCIFLEAFRTYIHSQSSFVELPTPQIYSSNSHLNFDFEWSQIILIVSENSENSSNMVDCVFTFCIYFEEFPLVSVTFDAHKNRNIWAITLSIEH